MIADANGFRQEGVSRFEMSVAGGYRSSSARSYLHSQSKRANLDVLTGAKVLRVLVEKGRAIGVELWRRGQIMRIGSSREVIMAAGVFGTPQVLMLSGNACAFMIAEKAADMILGLEPLPAEHAPYYKAI